MTESSSPLISEKDARDIVFLLGDVAAQNGGHEERKRTLMDGLCRLIGAEFWIWGLAVEFIPGAQKPPIKTSMMSGGFSEEQVPKLLVALDHRELEEVMKPLSQIFLDGETHFTRRHDQYDTENAIGLPHILVDWEAADIGAPMVYYRLVPNDCMSSIGLYRRFNDPPFAERESRIVDIVLTEVDWLHEQGWPWESALRVPSLSHRNRMALNLLLEGLPRKQIADHMDISIHTVNDYIKSIYEMFSVHSHAELLNRFRGGTAI